MEPAWIVFDERAILGDTDDAAVLVSYGTPNVTTDEQAIRAAQLDWHGQNFALYRYDLNSERVAENERLIYVGNS